MCAERLDELLSGEGGGSTEKPLMIKSPLVMMFEQDKKIVCHIHPGNKNHTHYGLLICDLVRHVARAFKVDEDAVWEWVDKERRKPTSEIEQNN
jgi:hypothetical protein